MPFFLFVQLRLHFDYVTGWDHYEQPVVIGGTRAAAAPLDMRDAYAFYCTRRRSKKEKDEIKRVLSTALNEPFLTLKFCLSILRQLE